MAQTFTPAADTYLRLFLLVVALTAVGGTLFLGHWCEPFYVRSEGRHIEQPVPFSHLHHYSDLGIECQYCHNTVEYSSFAGMPPTHTCMTCHSQVLTDSPILRPVRESYFENEPLRWQRVYDLPDFVQFDHAVHVNNGVGCESCHGRIDRMPITAQAVPLKMEWCLECHRNPAPQLRPRDAIFEFGWKPAPHQEARGRELMKEYQIENNEILTDCSICHY